MFISNYVVSVVIFIGIYVLGAWSVFFPISAGMFFVAAPGFMAIGAYTSAMLTKSGVPFGLALILCGFISALIGVLIGYPSLRLKFLSMAIVSIGFFMIVMVFFLNFKPGGAAQGLRGIPMLTTVPSLWAIILCVIVFFSRLGSSRLGRAIHTMSVDEELSAAMGVNVVATKIFILGVSAFIAALAGGFYAHYVTYIEPGFFTFGSLLNLFVFCVFGGMTTYWGPVLGTVILWVLPELIRPLAMWRLMFYATILIVVLILRPQGLLTSDTIDQWRKFLATLAMHGKFGIRPKVGKIE